MSEINTNNPPPSGFGIPLFQWIVANVLFLKRRLNGISSGGGSGSGMAIGNVVTDADPDRVLFTDASGLLAQSSNLTYDGTHLIINSDDVPFTISSSDGSSFIFDPALGTLTFSQSGSITNFTTLPNNNLVTFAGDDGIVALRPWVDGQITTAALLKLSIDGSNSMTGALNMGNQLINNVTDPSGAQDAATKHYVDAFVTGLSWKQVARVATTANLVGTYLNGTAGVGATFTMTATGVLSIDGVALVLGDRVIFKDQTTAFQNGIWQVTTEGIIGVATIFTRTTDADTSAELVSAAIATGTEGATNANLAFTQTTPATITIGTTVIAFAQLFNNAFTAGTGIRITANVVYARLSEGVTGGQTAKGGTAADDTFTIQGSTSTDPRTTTAPAIILNSAGPIGGSSGAQVFESTVVTVNASGTAGYTVMKVAVTETAVGSGAKKFIEFLGGAGGATTKFSIANTGTISIASGANLFSPGINTIADANYTLVLGDNQQLINAPFTVARNITIPPNSSVAFPTQARIDICNYGAGQVSIVAGVGVTIRSKNSNLKINGQYVVISLFKINTDEWLLVGDITS